ncbi:MAG: fibronectin type III domain-containing protein, partial [Anaerolineales bacterium]|nr:fibronectin type III domain-containing protein [Anaerolineales bacterium]
MAARHRIYRFFLIAIAFLTILPLSGFIDPAPVAAQEPAPGVEVGASLLADGQFVYGPNAADFSLAAYLEQAAPHLSPYAEPLDGRADYNSINPRVYLALMEMATGLVSNPDPAPEELENPFGLPENGFLAQVDALSTTATSAYYEHLYFYSALDPATRTLPPLGLLDGTWLTVLSETNAGSYAILAALASFETADQILLSADNNNPDGFLQTYLRLFPDDDPLDTSNQLYIPGEVSIQAIPPAGLLQLPYTRGETWYFGGVHNYAGGTTPTDMSSLDFFPAGLSWNSDTSNAWVVAAADGTALRRSACNFSIDHGGGWETRYYHLEGTLAYNNTQIYQNDRIGILANTLAEAICDGGSSTGPHVHFSLRYNGAYVPINGTALSGWVAHAGRWSYDTDPNYMWLERGGVKKYAGNPLLNDTGNSTPACPTVSGEVRLYDSPNCTDSYTIAAGTGLWSMASSFNDRAESIAIPSGWSARLYLHDSESSPSACIPSTDADLWNNTFSDGSVVANQTTWMRVYGNTSCASDSVSTPGLNSPANNATLNRNDNVSLSWNTASGATQYYVEFWGGPSISLNSGWISGTNWSLGTQWAGTYQWRVKARNGSGVESSWSETRTLYIRPGSPSSLSASTASSSQINLSWNGSVDGPSNIDGYRIYRNGTAIATVGGTTTTFSSTSLACATSYSYVVRAYQGSLESDASNTASATTSTCAPGVPTLNSPANGASFGRYDSVTLQWNTASGATQYYAEFWGGPGFSVNSGWITGTSFFVGDNFWGGTYQWRVRSRNSSGVVSDWSETRGLTRLYGTPSTPTATAIGQNQIAISWGPSADAPGNIAGYRIYRNGSPIATVGSATTTFTDTGLICNTSYFYTVKAYNGSLESLPTSTLYTGTSACQIPPAAPSNPSIAGTTASAITFSWQDNATNEQGFHIYKWGYDYDNAEWAFLYYASVGTNVTSFTDSGLPCGNDFNYYEVSAYNAYGESAHTSWVQGATQACPAAPNDDFDSPIVITATPYTHTQETSGATSNPDDPALTACNRGPGIATVWYRFTAPGPGRIHVDTIGSNYDTMLAIWTGERLALTSIACNDDRSTDLQSEVTATLNNGTTYYIEVAQYAYAGAESSLQNLGPDETPADVHILSGGGLQLHVNFTPLPPLPTGTFDDTHPAIAYAGTWNTTSTTGPANNTLHYATLPGSEAAFAINANSFRLTYTAYPNRGTAAIYVDGALYHTLDQYSPTTLWQQSWTSGLLPGAAPHTITIV